MSAASRITELSRLLEGTGITELTLSTSAETITLRRGGGNVEPVLQAGAPDVTMPVKAPCCGVLLSGHPLRQSPLVQVGELVQAGAALGLVRAGPLLLHVTAPCTGRVGERLVAEGSVVGYGTILMRLTPVEAE